MSVILTIDTMKDWTRFAKEHGVRSFKVGDLSVEFFSEASPVATPIPEPTSTEKSFEEQLEDADELLFASAGY